MDEDRLGQQREFDRAHPKPLGNELGPEQDARVDDEIEDHPEQRRGEDEPRVLGEDFAERALILGRCGDRAAADRAHDLDRSARIGGEAGEIARGLRHAAAEVEHGEGRDRAGRQHDPPVQVVRQSEAGKNEFSTAAVKAPSGHIMPKPMPSVLPRSARLACSAMIVGEST